MPMTMPEMVRTLRSLRRAMLRSISMRRRRIAQHRRSLG
jgi:hypothetical protein